MKGSDLAFVDVFYKDKRRRDQSQPAGAQHDDENVYEFNEFRLMKMARFITAMEAYMRILGVPIVWKSHTVY
jgi:hypothetical protein